MKSTNFQVFENGSNIDIQSQSNAQKLIFSRTHKTIQNKETDISPHGFIET